MKFELNEKEQKSAKKFREKIKKKYGSYGLITYSFSETGIGCNIKIKSDQSNKIKDITDYKSW